MAMLVYQRVGVIGMVWKIWKMGKQILQDVGIEADGSSKNRRARLSQVEISMMFTTFCTSKFKGNSSRVQAGCMKIIKSKISKRSVR